MFNSEKLRKIGGDMEVCTCWAYDSGADTIATIQGADYFSSAQPDMCNGDLIFIHNLATFVTITQKTPTFDAGKKLALA